MTNNSTFMKITNKDIYDKIEDLHEKIEEMERRITQKQDLTNGKVKNTKWIATTALTLCFTLLVLLVEHVINK